MQTRFYGSRHLGNHSDSIILASHKRCIGTLKAYHENYIVGFPTVRKNCATNQFAKITEVEDWLKVAYAKSMAVVTNHSDPFCLSEVHT